MKLKEISIKDAIDLATNKGDAYALMRIFGDTTIDQLSCAVGYYVEDPVVEPEKPKEIKSKVDHGRIVALYTANPPRTIKWIADDMGITQQTVINHLKKDGLYKPEENDK